MTTWYRSGICMEHCVSWLCVNVVETAGCANVVARTWLREAGWVDVVANV